MKDPRDDSGAGLFVEQFLELGLTELGRWRIPVGGSHGILWFGLVATKDTGSRLFTQPSAYYRTNTQTNGFG